MVEEERSVFAIFAPSELHARPDGFEQLLLGVFGLIRVERHERKAAVAAVAGGDVQTARAGISGFEVMDIIARGREGADAARRHDLAAGLARFGPIRQIWASAFESARRSEEHTSELQSL